MKDNILIALPDNFENVVTVGKDYHVYNKLLWESLSLASRNGKESIHLKLPSPVYNIYLVEESLTRPENVRAIDLLHIRKGEFWIDLVDELITVSVQSLDDVSLESKAIDLKFQKEIKVSHLKFV